jgi:hypothetical protein
MKARRLSIACLGALALCLALAAPAAQAAFGIAPGSLSATATDEDGAVDTLAGSHPYEYTLSFEMNQNSQHKVEGTLSELFLELPPGLLGDPQALPRCTRANFIFNIGTTCPGDTEVGIVEFEFNGGGTSGAGLYNLTPTPGHPATLGTHIDIHNAIQDASLRSSSDYGATLSDTTLPTVVELQKATAHVWGVPMDESHDGLRFCVPADPERPQFQGCASDAPPVPFLTLPASCTGPLRTTLRVRSVQGGEDEQSALSLDDAEEPVGLDGCNQLQFEPSISSQPTTDLADSPSGLDFDLHQAQEAPIEVGDREQRPGQSEACHPSLWEEHPTAFAYRWLRNGAPIAGAEARTYLAQPADAGTALQCEVTAANAAGATHAVSLAAAVSPAPPSALPELTRSDDGALSSPQVSGSECKPGEWSGSPSFAYQWLKNGSPVAGQTTSTYTAPLTPPYTLQCEVLATNAGGTVAAFSSNTPSSPPPSALPPSPLGPPAFGVAGPALPRATSPARDVTVTLPQGMSLNPSAANGLEACSEDQIGYRREDPEPGIHFSEDPQSCPGAAKVGTVEASSALLDHPVKGAVYVAAPYQNPFGSLLAIYLALEDPQTGIVAKLAGRVEPDPVTGQLKTTFLENPQLPIEDVRLHLFNGARAALKTPLACGAHTTTSTMTPWSAPEGADAHPSDTFQTTQPAGGSGTCPASEAQAPNKPSFSAGTVSPAAGAFSPFVLKLTRPDGSQQLSGIDTALPPGLTGKLAGIATCSEAQLAVAKSREAPNKGVLEQQSPSCPAASEVGTVTVGAGAGPTPFYATGHAYLAGPYKSAPLSLVVITPAVAGPFDLGDVVVRAALNIEPETARIHALSDPIPSILDGIPLDIRSIALNLGRPQFTLNPTSCNPMSITGSAGTLPGQSAPLSSPFQVGGCSQLPYKPNLTARLSGPTKRGKFPALRATLTAKGGEANTARLAVTLPHSEFLEQGHFGTICTRVQFAAKACPEKSVYGSVKVQTPLLDYPLEGPVYLRSSDHNLPDLVLALRGPPSQPIEIALDGRIDSKHSGIRTTFEALPDAPFTTATLTMPGGKKGLLVNSTNVCAAVNRATVQMDGQNGKVHDFSPAVVNATCKKGHKKKAHRKRAHRLAKGASR